MSAMGQDNAACCTVLELRQYTLKPQQRDVLIDVFDRHFVEPQEGLGMTLPGQFRDRHDPNRFVWLRGFRDMESRHKALEAFYGGPVWAAHRTVANNTMLDSDNVLLLKPARPALAFHVDRHAVGPTSERANPATVLAGIYQLSRPADAELVSTFEHDVAPQLGANHVRLEGVFVTESARNTFRLPVREGEHVLVWFGVVEDVAITPGWLERIVSISALANQSAAVLELEPTARSVMGNGSHAARATKHDFDFLFGSWKIHNRLLTERLRHSTEWVEFAARSDVAALLDGFGHLDRYSATGDGTPFEGMTLRLFDPTTGEWSLHWADTVRARTLLPPMTGRFVGGVGEFYGEETVGGKKVLCRFLWTQTHPDSPRWEQAFSEDDGKTWETNWIMTFTRP